MPIALTDNVTIRMTNPEWAIVAVEILSNATLETAAPLVSAFVHPKDGAVTLQGAQWDETLTILRNGRYAVVAVPITKIVTQANAIQSIENGEYKIEKGDDSPPVEAQTPPMRGRRPANA